MKKETTSANNLSFVLRVFIQENLRIYQPPTTRNPRAGKVGFSQEKYYSALLALTSLSVQEMAKEAKVKYTVLRKWRASEDFKALIAKKEDEFVETIIRLIWNLYTEILEKPKNGESVNFDIGELAEISYLNSDVVVRLACELFGILEQDDCFIASVFLYRGFLKPLINTVGDEKLKKMLPERANEWLKKAYIKEILRLNSQPETDKVAKDEEALKLLNNLLDVIV